MKRRKLNQNQCIEQGNRLKKCLKMRNLKQRDLAVRSGFSVQYISNMCRGSGIAEENVSVFAEILQVEPDYLRLKSDFANKDELLSDLAAQQNLDDAAINFLEALGYSIEDFPSAEPVLTVSFPLGASDQDILQTVKAAKAVKRAEVYRVITPTGQRKQLQRKELLRLLAEIQAFSRAYLELRIGK